MTETSKPKRHWWFWAEKSDYARLQRELKSFRVDLDLLGAGPHAGQPWFEAAKKEVNNAQSYLDEKDNIEGGWLSLHAARRHVIEALGPEKLKIEASLLRAEAPKIDSWRGDEMLKLLKVEDPELTPHLIMKVMATRDEYFSNQYHKIWLVGRQISILLALSGVALILFTPFVYSSQHGDGPLPPWGYQMVGAVLFFGLLGAAFSAAGSLMNTDTIARIPERVANQFVTIARALFGSGIGLAGYAFFQSKVLDLHFGNENGPGCALAVAFLFGFAGERLIAQVLGSIGSRADAGK